MSSAIGYFTRKEKLDVLNQWKCGGCKKHVCATKQFTIFRPPLTLCVQLKRFAFSGGLSHSFGSSGNSGQKICKRIQFPASFSLPLSDKRQCEYTLTGVIVHVGGSSKSGHYMAYVITPTFCSIVEKKLSLNSQLLPARATCLQLRLQYQEKYALELEQIVSQVYALMFLLHRLH